MLIPPVLLAALCLLMVAGVRQGALVRLHHDGDFTLTEDGRIVVCAFGACTLGGTLFIGDVLVALLWGLVAGTAPLIICLLALPPLHRQRHMEVTSTYYSRYVSRPC